MHCHRVNVHQHPIFVRSGLLTSRRGVIGVSAYLRKYEAAVSSYRSEEMKTHSYFPCEELRFIQRLDNSREILYTLILPVVFMDFFL